MDVTISGRHVNVTDAMRQHARERVGRLERYSNHIMHITVTLAIEGDRQSAEILVLARRKHELVAKSESHDMYQSIDHAADKMEKQLHKLEARVKDHRDGVKHKQVEGSEIPDEEESDESEIA